MVDIDLALVCFAFEVLVLPIDLRYLRAAPLFYKIPSLVLVHYTVVDELLVLKLARTWLWMGSDKRTNSTRTETAS